MTSHRFYVEPNNGGSFLTLDSTKVKKEALAGIHWNEADAQTWCDKLNAADAKVKGLCHEV